MDGTNDLVLRLVKIFLGGAALDSIVEHRADPGPREPCDRRLALLDRLAAAELPVDRRLDHSLDWQTQRERKLRHAGSQRIEERRIQQSKGPEFFLEFRVGLVSIGARAVLQVQRDLAHK